MRDGLVLGRRTRHRCREGERETEKRAKQKTKERKAIPCLHVIFFLLASTSVLLDLHKKANLHLAHSYGGLAVDKIKNQLSNPTTGGRVSRSLWMTHVATAAAYVVPALFLFCVSLFKGGASVLFRSAHNTHAVSRLFCLVAFFPFAARTKREKTGGQRQTAPGLPLPLPMLCARSVVFSLFFFLLPARHHRLPQK